MKKIINILLATLLVTGVSTISAHADENQATYAVVNSAGVVTNIIVCGPAVCGPNGSWNGTMPSDTPWAGQKLVLQVPVNTVTGQSQGGYLGTPSNPVTYNSQTQVFAQGSASTPMTVTKIETVDNATVLATIQSNTVTFGPNNVVNNQMQFTPVVTPTTGAIISATQTTGETRTVTSETGVVTTELVVTTENQSFTAPQTRDQIAVAVQEKSLLQRRLDRIYVMLRGWVLD